MNLHLGTTCITVDDGQKIYDKIHPVLLRNEPVELDFTGVKAIAAPFLNVALGQLLRDIPRETIATNLKLNNVSLWVSSSIKHILDNAEKYYHDPKYRKAVEKVISDYANTGEL